MIENSRNRKNKLRILMTILLVCLFVKSDMIFVQAGYSLSGADFAYDKDNLEYSFRTINDTTVTSTAQGKPKLLIFYDTTYSGSKYTLSTITKAKSYNNVDIIAIETTGKTKKETRDFINSYAYDVDYVTYCYSTEGYSDIAYQYAKHCTLYTYTNTTLPAIVYIDENNKIQYMTAGQADAIEVADNLNKYCKMNTKIELEPVFIGATNTIKGIQVKWKEMKGVDTYRIWYKTEDESHWWNSGSTSKCTYFHDNAKSGVKYNFKIEGYVENDKKQMELINYSEEFSFTYTATPDFTLRVNRAVGIGLGWNRIPGATGYAIYRKSYYENDPWVRVATIKDGSTTTWNDTSVKSKNGEVYKYTIRALAGSKRDIMSGCLINGHTMTRLTSRSLTSATKMGSNSIKCKWTTTVQATGYEVRFMVGDSVYKTYTLGSFDIGAKTFAGLKAGKTYKIQVRAYRKIPNVGSFYSAWSTPKYVKL